MKIKIRKKTCCENAEVYFCKITNENKTTYLLVEKNEFFPTRKSVRDYLRTEWNNPSWDCFGVCFVDKNWGKK